jgi:pimeloyl-ACP methyl ester carboxylesterase
MDISTLVLVGEFDVVEPVERVKEPVVERIPGARLKVLDNIGHLLPLEVPTEVAAQVDCFMQSFCS